MPINFAAYADGFRGIKVYLLSSYQLCSCIDLILLKRKVMRGRVETLRNDHILVRLDVHFLVVGPARAHSAAGGGRREPRGVANGEIVRSEGA